MFDLYSCALGQITAAFGLSWRQERLAVRTVDPCDEFPCTLEGWDKTLALNLDSVFYCCKYALQVMLNQRQGVIVNVSSVLGMVGGDDDFARHDRRYSNAAM